MHFYCCGLNLFWDGCNKIQILGPQIVDSDPGQLPTGEILGRN